MIRSEPLTLQFRVSHGLIVNVASQFQLNFRAAPHAREIVDEDAVSVSVSEPAVIKGTCRDTRDIAKSAVNLTRFVRRAANANLGVKRNVWGVCHAGKR